MTARLACVAVLFVSVWAAPSHARGDEPSSLSVYRLHPVADSMATSAALVAYVVPSMFQDDVVTRSCPCDRTDVNALDRHVVGNASSTAGHLSDLTVTLAIVAPAVGDAFALGWNRPLFEDAVVYAQTLFVNGALTTGAKLAFQRPRPITYTGDPVWVGKSEGYVSFYSGHTSTAFAALGAASMTIGYRYGSWALPWAVTALVGVSVAAERVAAGRHFYTDVGAGALAGIAVGVAVPWLHRRTGATVTPGPADSFGLGVSRRF